MSDRRRDKGSGQNFGKVMTIAAWLMAMLLLTFYFRDVEKAKHNPNRELVSTVTTIATEVVLKRNGQGHYVANGFINGVEVTFLVDTGATVVVIPDQLAAVLKLDRGMAIRVKTANGMSKSYMTTINELRLGEIVVNSVPAGLAVGLQGTEILLGMSFLADLELIQRGDKLIIKQYK